MQRARLIFPKKEHSFIYALVFIYFTTLILSDYAIFFYNQIGQGVYGCARLINHFKSVKKYAYERCNIVIVGGATLNNSGAIAPLQICLLPYIPVNSSCLFQYVISVGVLKVKSKEYFFFIFKKHDISYGTNDLKSKIA